MRLTKLSLILTLRTHVRPGGRGHVTFPASRPEGPPGGLLPWTRLQSPPGIAGVETRALGRRNAAPVRSTTARPGPGALPLYHRGAAVATRQPRASVFARWRALGCC